MKFSEQTRDYTVYYVMELYLCVRANEADIIIVGHHCNRLFVCFIFWFYLLKMKKKVVKRRAKERERYSVKRGAQWIEERLNSLEFSINHFHVNANEIFQFHRISGGKERKKPKLRRDKERKYKSMIRIEKLENQITCINGMLLCFCSFKF